jgi:predicted transposase/invertase (TIGR01784 family)
LLQDRTHPVAELPDRERILYDSRQDYEWTRNAEIAEAIQEGEKKGMQEGEKKGMQEGEKKGMQEGEKKGRADGERDKALSAARNLKRLGVATAVIAEATGLSTVEIEEL